MLVILVSNVAFIGYVKGKNLDQMKDCNKIILA